MPAREPRVTRALWVLGAFAFACVGAREPSEAAPDPLTLLPAGVRRLSNTEYDRAVSALLGFDAHPSSTFPPDTRQSGFTTNAAASVDAVRASLLHDAAHTLAVRATSQELSTLVPCAADADSACAQRFIGDFAPRVFRRALDPDERAAYLELFEQGRMASDFRGGIELVVQTLLESPSFLYLTELGAPAPAARAVRLTDSEVAARLAYAVSGAPPDAELERAAQRGALHSARGRELAARRLLGVSSTRLHYRRFVEEWLGLDGVADLVKDVGAFPGFAALRPALLEETRSFVDRVMIEDRGALATLLAGGYSVLPAELGAFYGAPVAAADGTTALAGLGRVGLLQQASFLAAHAHEAESGPVLRGVTVLRQVLCREYRAPTELAVDIVPPPPDAARTTRERFAAHASEPLCSGCHDAIDGVGFSFENFDASGHARSVEAGRAVDTSGWIELSGRRVVLGDSADLARALATDPEAERCLARQVFRYLSGRSEPSAEDAFVARASALPASAASSVLELVVSYVTSDAFVWRRSP